MEKTAQTHDEELFDLFDPIRSSLSESQEFTQEIRESTSYLLSKLLLSIQEQKEEISFMKKLMKVRKTENL